MLLTDAGAGGFDTTRQFSVRAPLSPRSEEDRTLARRCCSGVSETGFCCGEIPQSLYEKGYGSRSIWLPARLRWTRRWRIVALCCLFICLFGSLATTGGYKGIKIEGCYVLQRFLAVSLQQIDIKRSNWCPTLEAIKWVFFVTLNDLDLNSSVTSQKT